MRNLLLALTLLLASGAAYAQAPLRIALREDPDTLDPSTARTYVSRIVFAGLCDKLFDINEKLETVPMLALGYEWATPTELVLHLRPGVLFHDGETMDAEAVKYSLMRHLTMPGSYRRSEISALDHVDVVDPLTVKLVLKAPSSPFLAQLTDRSGMIVSPKAAEAEGKDFGLHPVCAGPFKFVERVPQDRIVLERFPQYWNAGEIKIDRVTYQPIPDSSIRLANLQAGSIDLSEYIVPTDVPAVTANPRLRMATSNSLGYETIEFNVGNGPAAKAPVGADARVRRALQLSIDRDALVQVVYNGLYATTAQAVSPDSPFYDKAQQPQPRDVAKAKALLKETGLPTPVVVNLIVPNNPDLRQAGEVIQSMAAEAGFDVRLTASEYASALATTARGEFEAFLTAWSGRVDPDGNLFSFLHTDGALNDGKYASKQADALLEKARATSDVPGRAAIYADFWKIESEDLPLMYIWQLKNLVGMSAKLTGFRPIPDGMIRLQGVSIVK